MAHLARVKMNRVRFPRGSRLFCAIVVLGPKSSCVSQELFSRGVHEINTLQEGELAS